jgi:putative hydrolase of the HAD superfamily
VVVEAVIFDWGGTLTPWVTVDDRVWWRVAARLVGPDDAERAGALLRAADAEMWRRSREEHRSATLAEVFAAGGVPSDELAHTAYDAEWEHATFLDPEVPELLTRLRARGLRIGVLSNTLWPRSRHEQIFARDAVDKLIDAAVYTSEIPWTKPHPEAFRAIMAALGVTEPAHCVFVGDRPFDDIFGAHQAGMRTVLVPHSPIPDVQRGHTDGEPDAVIAHLADLVDVVDRWSQAPLDG